MIPILDLPKDALNNVLKTMDKLSLVLLSILSSRTIHLVTLLKLELTHLIVELQGRVCLCLIFEDCDEIVIDLDTNGSSDDLGMLNSNIIRVSLTSNSQRQDDIWLSLENPNLSALCYSFESVARTVKGISIQVLQIADGYDVFRRVIHYFPIARIVYLSRTGLYPDPCTEFMAKLLIQNTDALYFESLIPITLNNLLMMNTPLLWTLASKISDRELNMYIRFWMNNPTSKLECLGLASNPIDPDEPRPFRVFNKNVILNGIDYIERPRDLVRVFQYSIGFHPYNVGGTEFHGGYDIKRRDGTNCSICINFELLTFQMFVWP